MKQQRANQARAEVNSVWQIDPVKENDCAYLTDRAKQINIAMEGFLQKNPSKTDIERTYSVMAEFETQYKSKIATLKCVEKEAQADLEKKMKLLDEGRQKATAETNKDAIVTPAKSLNANVTKYLLIGTGAVVLTLVGLAILKR
jgi:hypothetical protein